MHIWFRFGFGIDGIQSLDVCFAKTMSSRPKFPEVACLKGRLWNVCLSFKKMGDSPWFGVMIKNHRYPCIHMNPFTTSSDAKSSWANVITTQTHSQKKGRFGSWAWENFSMQGSFILVWVETEALWEVLGLIPFDTIDGSEIRLTSWGWSFIPWFTMFYTSQVVFSPDFWTINILCLKCLFESKTYPKQIPSSTEKLLRIWGQHNNPS